MDICLTDLFSPLDPLQKKSNSAKLFGHTPLQTKISLILWGFGKLWLNIGLCTLRGILDPHLVWFIQIYFMSKDGKWKCICTVAFVSLSSYYWSAFKSLHFRFLHFSMHKSNFSIKVMELMKAKFLRFFFLLTFPQIHFSRLRLSSNCTHLYSVADPVGTGGIH